MEMINTVREVCNQLIDAGEITRGEIIRDAVATILLTAVIIGIACHYMYWM